MLTEKEKFFLFSFYNELFNILEESKENIKKVFSFLNTKISNKTPFNVKIVTSFWIGETISLKNRKKQKKTNVENEFISIPYLMDIFSISIKCFFYYVKYHKNLLKRFSFLSFEEGKILEERYKYVKKSFETIFYNKSKFYKQPKILKTKNLMIKLFRIYSFNDLLKKIFKNRKNENTNNIFFVISHNIIIRLKNIKNCLSLLWFSEKEKKFFFLLYNLLLILFKKTESAKIKYKLEKFLKKDKRSAYESLFCLIIISNINIVFEKYVTINIETMKNYLLDILIWKKKVPSYSDYQKNESYLFLFDLPLDDFLEKTKEYFWYLVRKRTFDIISFLQTIFFFDEDKKIFLKDLIVLFLKKNFRSFLIEKKGLLDLIFSFVFVLSKKFFFNLKIEEIEEGFKNIPDCIKEDWLIL